MESKDLLGAWELVEYELLYPDGSTKRLWDDLAGSLTYGPGNCVSVLIVRLGMPQLQNSEVIAYSGTFKLDGDAIVHKVDISNLYHYLNQSLIRSVQLSKRELVLTSKELIKGSTHRVRWKRKT